MSFEIPLPYGPTLTKTTKNKIVQKVLNFQKQKKNVCRYCAQVPFPRNLVLIPLTVLQTN